MTIRLAFGKILLDAGKTLVVPAGRCATIRVHDGLVWATSSGNLDDVWLSAGQEHKLRKQGKTVIESAKRSTIEVVPLPSSNAGRASPSLAWSSMPAWLDDLGALIALVAIVAVMAIAGYRIATAVDSPQWIQDAQRIRVLDSPPVSAS